MLTNLMPQLTKYECRDCHGYVPVYRSQKTPYRGDEGGKGNFHHFKPPLATEGCSFVKGGGKRVHIRASGAELAAAAAVRSLHGSNDNFVTSLRCEIVNRSSSIKLKFGLH